MLFVSDQESLNLTKHLDPDDTVELNQCKNAIANPVYTTIEDVLDEDVQVKIQVDQGGKTMKRKKRINKE